MNNSTVAFTFSKNKLYGLQPESSCLSPWGTNHLLLYLKILRDIQVNKLKIDHPIIFTKESELELKAVRSTLGKEGEERLLIDVLNQAISLNAPDCIRALCQLYGGEQETRKILQNLADEIFISKNSQISLLGRLTKNQRSNIFDYYKIGLEFLKLNRYMFSYIKNRVHIIGGKVYSPQSLLDLKGDAVASIFWGTNQNDCLIFHDYDNQLVCTLVINGYSYIHTVENGINSYQYKPIKCSEISVKSPIMNILADTYFGEFYTERRKAAGREDALQKYGYQHSFEKLAQKLSKNDFNVVNYEGVLIKPGEECFNKHKVYYLGGDKDKTINELKNRSINLAILGNNHAKDYGEEALEYTLDSFSQNNIHTLGAGKNLQEAISPLIINYKKKKVALFSGYWHRRGRDLEFDFYATSRSGVASLDGALLDSIRQLKNDNPDIFIIIFPHWGVDFKDVSGGQKILARRLIQNGADLIIGSGPHKIQPIEEIDGKKVFYSLGNGVFNSNGGELKRDGHLLYGYFVKLDLEDEIAKVYPFWNYNLENFWQPYFVEQQQFDSVTRDISRLDNIICKNGQKIDGDGHLYYEISVTNNSTDEQLVNKNQTRDNKENLYPHTSSTNKKIQHINLKIYFLEHDLGLKYTGIESSALLRAQLFDRYLKLPVTFLTYKYRSHFETETSILKQRKKLPESAVVLSLYDCLQKFTGSVASKIDIKIHGKNIPYNNTGNIKCLNNEGMVIANVFYNKLNNRLHFINYFEDNINIRRDYYHESGNLSCTQMRSFGNQQNKIQKEIFYNRDRKICLIKEYKYDDTGKCILIEHQFFDNKGDLIENISNVDDFVSYVLKNYCGQKDENNNQQCILLVDKSRFFYLPAMKLKSEFEHIKVIAAVHNLHMGNYKNKNTSKINNNYANIFKELNAPDAVIVQTNLQRLDIIERFGQTGNVYAIPHTYENLNSDIIERKSIKAVYFARYAPDKKHELAIKSFSKVVEKIPQAEFHCFGAGDSLAELKKIVEDLGMVNNIFLHDWCVDVATEYESAALSIISSPSESFGLTIAESLAHGCPVVAFDVPYGAQELVQSNENGYLVPFGNTQAMADKVLEIMQNPALQVRLSNNARQSAERYSEKTVGDKWLQLFQAIIKN